MWYKKIKAIFKNISSQRVKRQSMSRTEVQNLFVEYLIVIDSSVYNNFASNYGSMTVSLLTQYINIFFTQIVSGVCVS